MGDVIVMSRPRTPASSIVAGESAAILFFTGVRYHRAEETLATPVPTIRRRRSSTRVKKPIETSLVG